MIRGGAPERSNAPKLTAVGLAARIAMPSATFPESPACGSSRATTTLSAQLWWSVAAATLSATTIESTISESAKNGSAVAYVAVVSVPAGSRTSSTRRSFAAVSRCRIVSSTVTLS